MAEPTQGHDRRLHEALGAYFEAVEAGRAPRPEDLIARHPDLAEDLATFFASDERFRQLVAPLKSTVAAPGGETVDCVHDPHPTDASRSVPDPANSHAPALPRGTRVRYLGDYELQRVLGRGGMGVVYRAKQISLNRLVAVKMIRAGLWAGDEEVRRFKNEAEAVANLDHPQIVTIHEVGEHDGRHYFSMKLVDGPSLADLLPRYAADPRAAARLVAEVARAVHHAHQRGILHRDLKPSNILLDPDGRPHVTDFGLAKRIEGDGDPSVSGSILGTPAYMSPEQASGRRGAVTTAADVYGLGAVLYATLAGRPPFQADSVVETLEQVRERAPERPGLINRRVDRDLETICLKCLDKDPRRRYDSAAALADDLERWTRGEPILARRTGTWERVAKWARRHPAAAALVGMSGIAALTLVGLGVALSYHSRLQAAYAKEMEALYYNRVVFAERELNDNTPHRAEELLDECPPDRRRWEWHYLKRQCRTELRTIPAHRHRVWSAPFSPDGRLIATGAENEGTLRVWDAETGREVRALPGNVDSTYCVFSPDGERVASVGGSRNSPDRVLIREVATGRTLSNIPVGAGWNSSLAFSPDGQEVAVASGELNLSNWVKVCDSRTGRERLTIPTGPEPAYYVGFSPDGTRLIAVVGWTLADGTPGKLNEIRVWDARTGAVRLKLRGHTRPVISARYSPDGRKIASASYDATVRTWDADTGRELFQFRGHRGCTNLAAFSPDGRRVASTSDDGSAKIWDAETGQELATLRGHLGGVFAVAFSPDGRRLVTTGYDGAVKIWDATSSPEARTFTASDTRINALAFSPDGHRLVTGGTDRTLRIWEVPTCRLLATWPEHSEEVWAVAFSPDGTRVASAAGDWQVTDRLGEVFIRDAAAGRILHRLGAHKGIARRLAFSPDGRRLISGGGELRTPGHEVIVWDVATGEKRLSIPDLENGVHAVAISPDGRRVAAGAGHLLRSWDAETGADPVTFDGHTETVFGIVYSHDGRRIFSAGGIGGTVRVWDAASGQCLHVLRADKWATHCVAVSPDGSRIASSGTDQAVKLWDAQTGQQLISLRGHAYYVWGVAFSPDGRWIASADDTGLVKLWDGSPWEGGRDAGVVP